MIAYDLDNVIAGEIDLDKVSGLSRSAILPIFKPEGEFAIITGRPVRDKGLTIEWLREHGIKPKRLYHENTDHKKAAEYKAKVLADDADIKAFVESSTRQANVIRTIVGQTRKRPPQVYTFGDLIQGAISEVSKDVSKAASATKKCVGTVCR